MATVDFNDCGTYMEGEWGGCDPAQWNGTAFIDSGSSNAYSIKFITDENRDAAYPPYTLTSLHVSVDNFGEDAFKRIDLQLFSPEETIQGSNDTHNHTFLFDPPIESSRLNSILVWTGYYPTQVLFINATGTFPGVDPCVPRWTSYIDTTEKCQEV